MTWIGGIVLVVHKERPENRSCDRFHIEESECLCERNVIVAVDPPELDQLSSAQGGTVQVGTAGDRRQQHNAQLKLG